MADETPIPAAPTSTPVASRAVVRLTASALTPGRLAIGIAAAVILFASAAGPLVADEPPSWPEAKIAAPSNDDPAPAAIEGRSLEAWRTLILPDAGQASWAEIPWRATFWEAVVEADRLRKPVLFWAMNGHPLGCT